MAENKRAAVIGLGLSGVGVLKNLLEAGFETVGFERNSYIGGLWKYNADTTQTTVLASTVTNISKQRNSFTDYPYPEDVPDHATAVQLQQYMESYVEHFALQKHFRLGVLVKKIDRNEDDAAWAVTFIEDGVSKTEVFDKIFVTTGTYGQAFLPKIEGIEKFKGKAIHVQAFKDPAEFAGKKVIVVGFSNTGGDTAVQLAEVADKVYLSHSHGVRLFKRKTTNGTAIDHRLTRRLFYIAMAVSRLVPNLSLRLATFGAETNMKRTFPNIKPEWKLLPAPPIGHSAPVVNDHIVDLLADGSVLSVTGIRRITDANTVELKDGSIISADAIIFSTGYRFDFSIFPPHINPTSYPSPEWDAAPYNNGLQYPRLYMGILHLKHADSLAFLGSYRGSTTSAFVNADVAGQAIAQLWTGGYPLPPLAERERWCEEHYRWAVKELQVYRTGKIGIPGGALEPWLNTVAGNGVNEKLGWGWEAWKFWWTDYRLQRLLMDGVDAPFLYRLFDGRRPKWEGAREAIEMANRKKEGKEKKGKEMKT